MDPKISRDSYVAWEKSTCLQQFEQFIKSNYSIEKNEEDESKLILEEIGQKVNLSLALEVEDLLDQMTKI